MHPEDRLAAERALQSLLAGECEQMHGEYRFTRPSGEVRWLAMSGRLSRGRNLHPLLVSGIAVDITEHKRTKSLLRRARANVQQQVKVRTGSLVAANKSLEQQVKVQTVDLVAANKSLERQIENRRKLERQLLEISEREQQRIGQDLHDGLGQQITGIIFHAHLLQKHLAAKGAKEAKSAAQVVALLDQAKIQARQIARGLQPVDPSPGGLMAGLANFAAATSDLYNMRCRFDCPEPVLVQDYTKATHLFRIAQEAVANAFRHSGARVIEIHLRRTDDGTVVLKIADDGCGLPKGERRRSGLGLHFMKYRAEAMGGTFETGRSSRGGTVVLCRVPRSEISSFPLLPALPSLPLGKLCSPAQPAKRPKRTPKTAS
jgi:signal transduction histidine kinase